jgi:Plasmid pRiA4b ORF-3-like protein
MTQIVRLRIEIDEVTPAVVRRVEVPLAIRLDDLHFVLQIAIGWQNCHPFEFRTGELAWGLIDRDAETNPLPAEKATLADLAARGSGFTYNYVFGDDWQHTVEIEALTDAAPDAQYPRLVSAEGRCPPADIGGPSGYESYLRALADPAHWHHDAMREWDEPDFDPNKVDTAALAANLANLAKYLGRRKAGAH